MTQSVSSGLWYDSQVYLTECGMTQSISGGVCFFPVIKSRIHL